MEDNGIYVVGELTDEVWTKNNECTCDIHIPEPDNGWTEQAVRDCSSIPRSTMTGGTWRAHWGHLASDGNITPSMQNRLRVSTTRWVLSLVGWWAYSYKGSQLCYFPAHMRVIMIACSTGIPVNNAKTSYNTICLVAVFFHCSQSLDKVITVLNGMHAVVNQRIGHRHEELLTHSTIYCQCWKLSVTGVYVPVEFREFIKISGYPWGGIVSGIVNLKILCLVSSD